MRLRHILSLAVLLVASTGGVHAQSQAVTALCSSDLPWCEAAAR
ncbi:MAG: iron ABC transporter substrate-binding protein, partial [Comamonadaceae bacterium]